MSEKITAAPSGERMYLYRIVRYLPNLVRDEWLNIGVLLFDPATQERRLRLISDTDEFARIRRLHPEADDALLRRMQEELESRFEEFSRRTPVEAQNGEQPSAITGPPQAFDGNWERLLTKWDDVLSNAVQLTESKASMAASDIDAELERLYADQVALQSAAARVGAPGS